MLNATASRLACGAVLLFTLPQCTEEEPPLTEILLSVYSTASVDEVRVRARNIDYDADEITRQLEGQDIVEEPWRILITPSDIVKDEFLVHAKGYQGGIAVVAAAKVMAFEPGQRLEVELKMYAGFRDGDDDGFQAWPCSDEACDCNDSNPFINPFTKENCDDRLDNNCSGYPVNEGCDCNPLETPERPCTALPLELLHLAGIGECKLGVQYCVDGQWEQECHGAGTYSHEELANGNDDNCDGTVDEGLACMSGVTRACFLGLVGAELSPWTSSDTGAAYGECAFGVQNCTGGTWGPCEGEQRPQRLPAPEVGWRELMAGPSTAGQCDGLDNDCDGLYDEEEYFDTDGDGYTTCGTIMRQGCDPTDSSCKIEGPPDAEYYDCDDNSACSHPFRDNDCRSRGCDEEEPPAPAARRDWDCRCDHDPFQRPKTDPLSVIGKPSVNLDGSRNCDVALARLRCEDYDEPHRSDPNPVGDCPDGGGQPYYQGYFMSSITGEKACYFCDAGFGHGCSEETGRCTTPEEDCNPCNASVPPSDSYIAEPRPLCRDETQNSCIASAGPSWADIAQSDPYNECGPVSCAGRYHGRAGPQNAECYEIRDALASEANCTGDGQCDGSDPLLCCDQPPDICTVDRGPKGTKVPIDMCTKVTGGCLPGSTVPPEISGQADGEDLFDECNQQFACSTSANGGPHFKGISGTPAWCYYKDDVTNNACKTELTCRTGAEACAAMQIGSRRVPRGAATCKIPSAGCTGTTPPVYGINVPRGQDPYGDCVAGACCENPSGAAVCCKDHGQACAQTSECKPDLHCVDGVCCEAACDGICLACSDALTGEGDGFCRPIQDQIPDDNAASVCSGALGCGGSMCVCEAATGMCKRDNGQSCPDNASCASGYCRADWDGAGSFCARDATSCVDDDGGTVDQHSSGWVECDGGDAYRVCTGGVWSAAATCGASTCNNGCGYVTDADNACVSGQGLGAAGGCEYGDLDINFACVDCGELTARAGACNSGLSACSTACGAQCESGQTHDSGVDICNDGANGDSFNRIDVCAVTGQDCLWYDNGAVNDSLNQACGDLDCAVATGSCLASCTADSDCNAGLHCVAGACHDNANGSPCDSDDDCASDRCDGTCMPRLVNGSACDEDSDCINDHCRVDWDGAGSFCAQDATSCVHDGGGTVAQRSSGWVECDGGDAHRVCTNGVWSATATACDAATCNGGCGYLTDDDNACVSGQGLGTSGGCEYEHLNANYTCNDCGDFSASASGCNSSLSACSTVCGAQCESGQTHDSGVNVCNDGTDGDSFNRIDVCSVVAGGCVWTDDASPNDTLNQGCGDLDCAAGECLTTCIQSSDCNTAFHCVAGQCHADGPGSICDSDDDCAAGSCRIDWDGTGRFCPNSASGCVDDDSGSVAQHASGWVECDGGDAYRVCSNGVWTATATACDAATCDGGCGYVTDDDNACISGQVLGTGGGCELGDLGSGYTCHDCGGLTAHAGGCDSGLSACRIACGADCESGQTRDSGTDICVPDSDGDSYDLIEGCAVSVQNCYWDDATAADTLRQACGDYDCVGGACLTTCSINAHCNTDFHCYSEACYSNANGNPCDSDDDCTSGRCDDTCMAKLGGGSGCDEESDCMSNSCTAGTCD